MFRKKDQNGDGAPASGDSNGTDITAPPLKPFSRKGSHLPSKSGGGSGQTALRHDIPRRGVEPSRRYDRLRPGESESKKLTVGRDICLSGEITSCNKLVVEGRVEAALNDAHAIEIAPTGFFKGSAEVIEADISGLYEGELVAREILTVRSGGRINGTVRYGRIIIEAGGEISGDMRALGQGEETGSATSPESAGDQAPRSEEAASGEFAADGDKAES
ncbi:MAG: polymer-forming cytoskeletal protein [Rhodospirillales bacterium]|nr:polymer-forming cytoskeletal protein [Rhodospirillales bacterium]